MKKVTYLPYGYDVQPFLKKSGKTYALILCNIYRDDAYILHVGDDYNAIEEVAINISDAMYQLNEYLHENEYLHDKTRKKYLEILDVNDVLYSGPLF